ncbi:hypothetical protein [Halococcus saccharolyticus]|uniref:HTH luxR-type domain-containing protein n=1 Tax=Halococcus saccharolyticus DSM 5350 TaxID=1227455 RepID=M0MQ20_9EURY|nr:hypothetical protein [Halococcus saccharolyticus]EMA46545.1 hypothetical protein C449_04330 [Halococcus saccharolyticus DSM 5350]
MSDDTPSILSHEEEAIAAALAEGTDPVTIADDLDSSVAAVEASIDRIREKTERAFATLEASPFAADLAHDLDPERRAALRTALGE